MADRLSLDMLRATRLTRAGRLVEATEFLQHLLRGESPVPPEVTDIPPSSPARPDVDLSIGGRHGGAVIPHLPNSLRGLLERMKRVGLQTEPGGSVSRSPAQARDIVPEGGQFLERSYSNHAGGRPYKLYVPSGYRGQAVPLVVMLHGCTQSPEDFAAGTRMNEMAEEHTCLVAYPAQVASANASKCWNWFSRGDQQRGQGEPALIAGITREVMAEYRIDQQRVYIAGLSAGGAAAAIMGATYPDLYAAIGVHSGLACGSASDLPSAFAAMRRGGASAGSQVTWLSKMGHEQIEATQRAVPTIVFHGDQDKTVHPCNGDEILAQFGAGIAELQTTVESGRVPSGHSYSRTRLCDASGQAIFENWVIHGAGHAWSGGVPPAPIPTLVAPMRRAKCSASSANRPIPRPKDRSRSQATGKELTMRLQFDAISEATPGPKWQRIFAQSWPGWREWQQWKTTGEEPSLAECERALGRYMPELLPVWRRMVELTGENEAAARFLSFWCPPPCLVSCSQAVLIDGQGPLLIRNYDLEPALNEANILRSAWTGRLVMAAVEGIAGAADGINESGLAASLTFGGRINAGRGFGIPLIVRYLLEVCSDTQEAVEALRSVPCHMSYNVTIVDSSGKFATVYLSPHRPPVVTMDAATTNHQLCVEWPAHARRSRSIERKDFLTNLLAKRQPSGEQVLAAFLAPPLFSTKYAEGFGTVYTTLYRPGERSMALHWKGQPPWKKTMKAFCEDQRTVVYPIDLEPTGAAPDEGVTALRKSRSDEDLARWRSYLPTDFAQALASNIQDPETANWAALKYYYWG